jgi:aarF domain-containing kinase
MTGRLGFEGTWDDSTPGGISRATNMIELTSQTDEERALIIDAVMNRGGIIEAVFEMLRRLPRRILMVLKLVSRSASAGIRMIIMRVERPYKVAISQRMRV